MILLILVGVVIGGVFDLIQRVHCDVVRVLKSMIGCAHFLRIGCSVGFLDCSQQFQSIEGDEPIEVVVSSYSQIGLVPIGLGLWFEWGIIE